MHDDTLLADVFEALNMTVLQRTGPYSFTLQGRPPQFMKRLFIAPQKQGTLPWERSPMLDHFLEQAEPFWMLGSRGVLRSGPWIEHDEHEREYALEAMALCPGESRVLLIREMGREYEERLRFLQQSRERRLKKRRSR